MPDLRLAADPTPQNRRNPAWREATGFDNIQGPKWKSPRLRLSEQLVARYGRAVKPNSRTRGR